MTRARALGRRFAWLMAGAAIGLALVLLVVTVLGLLPGGLPAPLVVLMSLASGAALGLVPGVRELEVTGARTMLGVGGELLAPQRMRAAHRVQTAAWVLLHLAVGLAVTALLVMAAPTAVVALYEGLSGRALALGTGWPMSGPGRSVRIVLGILVLPLSLLAWWPLGAAMARWAPRFLGPTAHDRLALIEARAEQEAQRNRIARELHDGIGHALTIVGIQAAAARRVQHRDPAATTQALETIEHTAREATEELDGMLAVLREDRPLERGPSDLEALIRSHRRAGLELEAELELPSPIAQLQLRHLHRIVAELLTNAHRHQAAGPVRLSITHTDREITVEVTNPFGGRAEPRVRGGRGLTGLRERAELLGGRIEAGPHEAAPGTAQWTSRAILPILVEDREEPT